MKIYLLCTLDSEHYREPYFYFFKTAFAAHKWVIDNLVSITEEEMMDEVGFSDVEEKELEVITPKIVPVSKAKCPQCGGELVFEGGCNTCKNCGWSKCD